MQKHTLVKDARFATLQELQATERSIRTANLQNKQRLPLFSKPCYCLLQRWCGTCNSARQNDRDEKELQQALTAGRKQFQQLQVQQKESFSANGRAEETKNDLIDHLEGALSQADSIVQAEQGKLRGVKQEVEVLARQYAKSTAEQQRAQCSVETLTISLLVSTSCSPEVPRQSLHREQRQHFQHAETHMENSVGSVESALQMQLAHLQALQRRPCMSEAGSSTVSAKLEDMITHLGSLLDGHLKHARAMHKELSVLAGSRNAQTANGAQAVSTMCGRRVLPGRTCKCPQASAAGIAQFEEPITYADRPAPRGTSSKRKRSSSTDFLGLPTYLHSSAYYRKRLRQLNEAQGDPELDQRQEVEAKINALLDINQQQVSQFEELHRHSACCACTVDVKAADEYLWAQKQRAFQLLQEIQAVDESIEAVRAAMSDAVEQHHLRLESLVARVEELETQYQPWRDEVDQVSHATFLAVGERDQVLAKVQLQNAQLSSVKANKAALAKALRQMRKFHADRQSQASLYEARFHARKAQARKVQQAHCDYSELSQQLLLSCDAQLAELHQLLAAATWGAQQRRQQMACASSQHSAVEAVSELRQRVLSALQQHTNAAAGCQAELAKVTGVRTQSRACFSAGQPSQEHNMQGGQPVDEEEAQYAGGKETAALKGATEKKRQRDAGEEEQGGFTKRLHTLKDLGGPSASMLPQADAAQIPPNADQPGAEVAQAPETPACQHRRSVRLNTSSSSHAANNSSVRRAAQHRHSASLRPELPRRSCRLRQAAQSSMQLS